MRIAQFTESYRPVINGAAVAVGLLVEELERRHAVQVFAPQFPGYRDPTPTHRFPSYRLPHHRDYPLAIPHSPALKRRFVEERFEVVHTHSPFALGQVGRRWARRAGAAVVTTYHTLYVEYAHYAPRPLWGSARAWLRRLSRDYCNACDAVAVPSEPVRQVLLDYGVRVPIAVVPTGLKLARGVRSDGRPVRARLGIPSDAVVVLYAGRLAPEKNLELLLDAYARVARDCPRAWLLMAGGGPDAQGLARRAAALGVGERTVFAGFVEPQRMAEVYAAADLFAFTSLTDTQGLVLNEAKAAGLPAVAVDAFGPGTVVAHEVDGLLAQPTIDAMAAAMRRLVEDPGLRSTMARAALERAEEFSIAATAAAYEAIYLQALQRRGG